MDDSKTIYADDLTACPDCGSTEFDWFFTGTRDDKELTYAECVVCGTTYPGRDIRQRWLAKTKADNEKKAKAGKGRKWQTK